MIFHDREGCIDDTFEEGVRAVTRIRCLAHRDVAAYNHAEASGAECAACAVEAAVKEAELRVTKAMIHNLNVAVDQARSIERRECAALVRSFWEGLPVTPIECSRIADAIMRDGIPREPR